MQINCKSLEINIRIMLCVIPSCFTYELLPNEDLRMKVGSTNYGDRVNFFQNMDMLSINRSEIISGKQNDNKFTCYQFLKWTKYYFLIT